MADAHGSVNSFPRTQSEPDSDYAVSPDVAPSLTDATSLRFPARTAGGQFILEQNYPNPHTGETTVPFTLANTADVRLDIIDLMGRKVAGVVRKNRSSGTQSIKLNLTGLGLPTGDYIYELQVSTRYGVYRQSKQMTTK